MNKIILSLFLVLAFSISTTAKEIRESQVPQAVRSYVEKNFPDASNKKWEYKDKDNRFYYYRVEFKVKGNEVRLELDENGKLLLSREEISVSDMPQAVKSYVDKNYPGSTILSVRKEMENNTEYYNVGVKFKNNQGYTRHRNIHIDTNGKLIN